MMPNKLCQYCAQPIRFVATEGGKRMPINPDPDPNGNVIMVDGRARVLTNAAVLDHTGQRWMPHFTTCPNARRGKRKGR